MDGQQNLKTNHWFLQQQGSTKMLLTEVFHTYTISEQSNPVLNIPLKFITVPAEIDAKLTPRLKKKYGVLAQKLLQGEIKETDPIQVKKTDRGFELVSGNIRFQGYKKAGRYSIPCEVISKTVEEDTKKYILYINDKPSTYYSTKEEAEQQARIVRQRYPKAKIDVQIDIDR
jgi:hypothetical protein